LTAPVISWTKQAVAGKTISGVTVAVMIRSISEASIFASAIARRAASAASVAVVSPSPAIWRVLIPVRVVIHSSAGSTILVKSSLVRIFSGTAEPVPAITARKREAD
jgi:hypothetical protein